MLTAILFIGWVLRAVADDNQTLHKDKETDAVVIQKLAAALDQARQHNNYVLSVPSSSEILQSVRSSDTGRVDNAGGSPKAPTRPGPYDPAYVSSVPSVRTDKYQIISTGPLQW